MFCCLIQRPKWQDSHWMLALIRDGDVPRLLPVSQAELDQMLECKGTTDPSKLTGTCVELDEDGHFVRPVPADEWSQHVRELTEQILAENPQ